jgi:hypothetical protein
MPTYRDEKIEYIRKKLCNPVHIFLNYIYIFCELNQMNQHNLFSNGRALADRVF